jgi:uncharacterized membrane protein YbaN (DUF454 family)
MNIFYIIVGVIVALAVLGIILTLPSLLRYIKINKM